jgi:hypothetical protein
MVEAIQQSISIIGSFTKEEAIEKMNKKGLAITCDVSINNQDGITEYIKIFNKFGCVTEINNNGIISKDEKSWHELPEHSLDDVNIICSIIES